MKLINFTLVNLVLLLKIIFNNGHKTIMLDRLEDCNSPENSPYISGEFSLKTINHTTLVDHTFEMKRDINRMKIVAKVTRCAYKEALDSCAYFTTLRMQNGCPLLKQKGTIVSTIFLAYNPPAICPFRKGVYVLVNGTYDPNLMQFFPMDKWYWKLEINGYDSNTNEHICRICVEGRIV